MIRLVSGQYRGRKLSVPDGLNVRPTSERMRERIFSMLMHPRYPDLAGSRFADIFAGSGAMGLEALSRGCLHVTFIENNHTHIKNIQNNIKALNAEQQTSVYQSDALNLSKAAAPFDFIFLDPPYDKGLLQKSLNSAADNNWLHADTIVITEMSRQESVTNSGRWHMIDERVQGKQKIQFLQLAN